MRARGLMLRAGPYAMGRSSPLAAGDELIGPAISWMKMVFPESLLFASDCAPKVAVDPAAEGDMAAAKGMEAIRLITYQLGGLG